jgi:hypothetical protein
LLIFLTFDSSPDSIYFFAASKYVYIICFLSFAAFSNSSVTQFLILSALSFNLFFGGYILLGVYLFYEDYRQDQPKFKVGDCVQDEYLQTKEFEPAGYDIYKIIKV